MDFNCAKSYRHNNTPPSRRDVAQKRGDVSLKPKTTKKERGETKLTKRKKQNKYIPK